MTETTLGRKKMLLNRLRLFPIRLIMDARMKEMLIFRIRLTMVI